jgi:hypothetical protein
MDKARENGGMPPKGCPLSIRADLEGRRKQPVSIGIPERARKAVGHQEISHNGNEWRRWDEDLVEEFGRWLSRFAKAFAILLLSVLAAVVMGWFWKRF